MMLLTMIAQDLAQNKGLCLIDPHGDLVDAALAHIPENRKDDVFIFDPSDQDYVVGLNFLETTSGSEAEKDYVRLHAGKNQYLVRARISELALRLKDHGLHRIHRSTIVRLADVCEVRRVSKGLLLVMADGAEFRASRHYVAGLPLPYRGGAWSAPALPDPPGCNVGNDSG